MKKLMTPGMAASIRHTARASAVEGPSVFGGAGVIFGIALAAVLACGAARAGTGMQQTQPPGAGSQAGKQAAAPGPEVDEAKKVDAAVDAAGRLQAAGDFIKKFPHSTLIKTVAALVAEKISESTDPAAIEQACLTFEKVFEGYPEAHEARPMLLAAYIKEGKTDDAFREAGEVLKDHPDDLRTLTNITMAGFDEARKGNTKYVAPAEGYGRQAIKLIESDKKPADFTDTNWAQYKTNVLPDLYRQLGLMSVVTSKPDDAKASLEKAVSLNPADAFSFFLLGTLADDRYQQLAKQANAAQGPDKLTEHNKALEAMDEVIELYAHAAALSDENSPLHAKALENMEPYYKFRHGGTDGMQALIDKYKAPPAASGAPAKGPEK